MNLEEIIQVISKPPKQRTRNEVREIVKWLQKRLPLFKDLDMNITSIIVCNCRVSVIKKGHLVIKQGDKGDTFFVILKGQVSVYVVESKTSEPSKKTAEKKTSDESSKENEEKTEEEIFKSKQPKKEDYGNKVAVYRDGGSFGELALQHTENVRAASVITDTTTYFLVVDKDLYDQSIKSIQAEELTRLKSYVENHVLFEQWPIRLQNSITHCMNKVELNGGVEFVKQGSRYHGMWFIVGGEVKITIDNRHEFTKSGGGPGNNYLSSDYVQIKRVYGYIGAEKYQNSKHEDVCVLRTPDTIGDIEQLLHKENYTHSAETVGQVTLYFISSDNLKRLFHQLHKQGVYQQNQIISTWIYNANQNWHLRNDYIQTSRINEIIDQLKAKLEPIERHLGIPKQAKPTPRDKTFQALIDAYMLSRAPLIEPVTNDGHVFKLAIQKKADRRRHYREIRGRLTNNYAKPPHRLKSLVNTKKARSITTLKSHMKKLDTEDADILIPPSKIRPRAPPPPNDDIVEDLASVEQSRIHDDIVEELVEQPPPVEQRRIRASVPNLKHDPELVQGKTLRFFSHYLKGRLEKLYEIEQVPRGVTEANNEVLSIEKKLKKFYKKEKLPTGEISAQVNVTDDRVFMKSLKQLDVNGIRDVLPGGKCTVVMSPCSLIGKQFKVKNHNHVRRHMVRGSTK